MDCGLSTWPSIQQFDDLHWMGLGDIDPLESPDRRLGNDCQLAGTSFENPDYTDAASPTTKVPIDAAPSQIVRAKSDDFYMLTSAESLAAARWDSINAVDLASVLDGFPCSNDTSTPSEDDAYDLYSESIMLQEESALSGEVDAFMSAPVPELADIESMKLYPDDKSSMHDDTNVIYSNYGGPDDVKCETGTVNYEREGSIQSLCPMGRENRVQSEVDRKQQNAKLVADGHGGSSVGLLQPSQCGTQPISMRGCHHTLITSEGALDIDESISPLCDDYIQPASVMQWSKPASTAVLSQLFGPKKLTAQLYNREQVVQQTPMTIMDDYPAILDQQVRIADAARVTSELKRNRAQASRARRLAASQRRAKKYPLQKHIRMSSSSASIREKLDLGTATELHGPLDVVSQSLVPNTQLPAFSPMSSQRTGNHLLPSHELMSLGNAMQANMKYQYQHPIANLDEVKYMSLSGSSTVQTHHDGQNLQLLTGLPTYGITNVSDPTHSLDAVLLSQLQNIMSEMNVDMRLCIRDALFRLARSAKDRQSRTENVSGVDENERQLPAMETNTNSIDRWTVNMLFCMQPTNV